MYIFIKRRLSKILNIKESKKNYIISVGNIFAERAKEEVIQETGRLITLKSCAEENKEYIKSLKKTIKRLD